MDKKLKVGVIGVGGIAGTHFPGWHASEHADVAALDAGKHVICEKPLSLTPADVDTMIAARDRSGKLLMTAQHFRFEGTAIALKAEIEKGVLGDIYHTRCWMLRRNLLCPTEGFVTKKNAGGGACIDIGVHILDLALWLMGNPKPVSVSGVTQDYLSKNKGAFSNWGMGVIPDSMDVEEFAAAFVRFEGGGTLILEVSWLLHHKMHQGEDMQLWLYGDDAGAHWPSNELYSTDYDNKQLINRQLLNAGSDEAHAAECIAFAEAVATGAPSPVPAEQSRDVITILDGLYRSAESKREVALDG